MYELFGRRNATSTLNALPQLPTGGHMSAGCNENSVDWHNNINYVHITIEFWLLHNDIASSELRNATNELSMYQHILKVHTLFILHF